MSHDDMYDKACQGCLQQGQVRNVRDTSSLFCPTHGEGGPVMGGVTYKRNRMSMSTYANSGAWSESSGHIMRMREVYLVKTCVDNICCRLQKDPLPALVRYRQR
jgi:hypothetical protein